MRTASISCSGDAFLSRKPLAPAKGFEDVLVEVEGREDDDPGGGLRREDRACGLEAVGARHSYVHEDDVGREPPPGGEGQVAVRGLGHDLDVWL
jgi:hypothetical protein